MSKIIQIISIFIFSILLISCGYKKISQKISNINIINIKVNSKNKNAYNLRNNILLISNAESKNKYDITVEVSKKKSSKIKNKAGKTTRFNLNISTKVIFKNINNLQIIDKSFFGNADYDVAIGHAETVSNEKNANKVIIEQISDDIRNFITLSLKN